MSEQEVDSTPGIEPEVEAAPEPQVPDGVPLQGGREPAPVGEPVAQADAPPAMETSAAAEASARDFGSRPLDHVNQHSLSRIEDKLRTLDLLTHGLESDLSIVRASLGPLVDLQAHYVAWHKSVDDRLAGLGGTPESQPGVVDRLEALEKKSVDLRRDLNILSRRQGLFNEQLATLRQESVERPGAEPWGASGPCSEDTQTRELGALRGEIERLRQKVESLEATRGGLSSLPDQASRELVVLRSQVGELREEFERLAVAFWPMARGGSLQGEGAELRGEVEALRRQLEGVADLPRRLGLLASQQTREAGEVGTHLAALREKFERLAPLLDRLARALLDEAEEVPQQSPATTAPAPVAPLRDGAVPEVLRALRALPPEQAQGLSDWTSAVDRLHQRMEEERRFEERAGALVELLRERLLAGRARDELAEARNRMVFVDLPDLLAQSEDLARCADTEGRRALDEFRRRVLEVVGLDEIHPRRGEPFDASRHSMLQASHEDGPENTVARCLAPGLVLRATGQLVRKADVSVHL